MKKIIWLTLILVSIPGVTLRAQSGGDDEKIGNKAAIKKIKEELRKIAEETRSKVVAKNNEAAEKIKGMLPSAQQASQQVQNGATIIDSPQDGGATSTSLRQPLQGSAQSSAQSWPTAASSAQQLQQAAAQARNEIQQKLTPYKQRLEQLDKRIKEHAERVRAAAGEKAGRIAPQELPVTGGFTDSIQANQETAQNERRQDFDRVKKAYTEFEKAVRGGAIKDNEDKTKELVTAGNDYSQQAGQAVGSLQAQSQQSFSSAMSPVSNFSGLQKDNGDAQANSAVNNALSGFK